MQCANCGGGHFANSNQCTLRHNAKKEERRKKTIDKGKANEVETNEEKDKACDEASLSPDMDLETEEWRVKKKKKVLARMKFLNEKTTQKTVNVSCTKKLRKRV